MQHLGEPGHILNSTFEWGIFPAPNSLFYLATYSLAAVIDTIAAGRTMFAFSIAALPWALAYFLVSFGRNRWLALAGVPLSVQWPLIEGLIDYWLGLSILLLALGAAHRYLSRPSRRGAVLAAMLGAMTFLAHIQIFAYYAAAGLLLILLHAAQHRHRPGVAARLAGRALALVAPALLLAAWWYLSDRAGLREVLTVTGTVNPPADTKLHEALDYTLLLLDGPGDGSGLFALIISMLVARILWSLFTHSGNSAPSKLSVASDAFPAILVLLLIVVYVFAPENIGFYWNVHRRMPAAIAVLAVALTLPAGSPLARRWMGPALALPFVVTTVFVLVMNAGNLSRWNDYTHGLLDVLHAAPPQSRLVYWAEQRTSTGFRPFLWRHLDQYHTIVNGGVTPFSFGVHRGRLVKERDSSYELEIATFADLQKMDAYGCFDVVLQAGPSDLEARLGLTLLARQGQWALYRPDVACAAAVTRPEVRGND